MEPDQASVGHQFQDALIACKRLYISAARQMLEQRGETRTESQYDLIRRMVDLHKGLVVKIYANVAKADHRWGPEERELARILIDHLWHQQLDDEALRVATRHLIRDAAKLKWYSLVRLFDEVPVLHDRAAELQTIVMRLGNLVAKADGRVTRDEADALRGLQQEIEVLLQRIPLEDGNAEENNTSGTVFASRVATESAGGASDDHMTHEAADDDASAAGEELSLAEAIGELERLVGLEEVKKEVRLLTNFLALQQRRKEVGLSQQDLSLHMIFMGNPGTGKTTVARIVGRIFRALGMLEKGHLVETDRSGLVAEYAGQTGPKTQRKVDEALDGVLFIDEAYSLIADAAEDPYGREAVQVLIKRMEDNRDRLVLILAGYPEPMQRLIRSNPGMRSRFNTQLVFDDYNPVDLGRICQRMCSANQYELPAATRAKLLLGFQWLYDHRDEHFGNGRLVRNVFEDSVRRLANRIVGVAPITRELLTVLMPEDIHMDGVPQAVWEPLEEDRVSFRVHCPKCSRSIRIKTPRLGTRIRCPACKTAFVAEWGEPRVEPRAE